MTDNLRSMFDRGSGPALVVVPGIQGRWEWIEPALVALARTRRVLSYSLCGEPTGGARIDPAAGFESYVAEIDRMLDERRLDTAAICGVSFGGLIAIRYAAERPKRVTGLVLVSSLPPRWRELPLVSRYGGSPWRRAPVFVATAPARLWPEIRAAAVGRWAAAAFALRHLARVMSAPCSPRRMDQRLTLAQSIDFVREARRIATPTLVLTGERALDRVVPVAGTRAYVELIPGARHAVLDRTGHIGLVTRPDAFATIVEEFLRQHQAPRSGTKD